MQWAKLQCNGKVTMQWQSHNAMGKDSFVADFFESRGLKFKTLSWFLKQGKENIDTKYQIPL